MKYKTSTTLQMQSADCGAASLKMILDYHNFKFTLEELRKIIGCGRDGSSVGDIINAGDQLGFKLEAKKYSLEEVFLFTEPCIMWWNKNHFLIYEGNKRRKSFLLNDPAIGKREVNLEEFVSSYSEIFIKVIEKPASIQSYTSPSITTNKDIYKSFVNHLKPQITTGLLVALASAIPVIFTARLTSYFIDNVVVKNQIELGAQFLWIFFFLAGLTTALTLTTYKILNRITFLTTTLKTYSFAKQIVSMPFKWLESRNSDELSNRLVLPSQVSVGICYESVSQIATLGRSIILSGVITLVSPLIGMAAFLMLGILAFVTIFISNETESINKQSSIQNGVATGISISSLVTLKEIRTGGLENERFAQWSGFYTNFLNSQQKVSIYQNITGLFSNSAYYLLNTTLITLGPLLIISGRLTVGNYISIQYLVGIVTSGFMLIPSILENYQNITSSSERFRDVFEGLSEKKNKQTLFTTKVTTSLNSDLKISIDSLSYGYDKHNVIFEGMSGTVPISNLCQIISPSGGGKTTFLKLLAGVLTSDSGSIYINQGEKTIYNPDIHYANYISNNPTFIRGSLLDNITLLDPSINHTDIINALEASKLNLYPLLSSSSFSIGFGGENLDEQVKSRILLARIYASPHKVVIIDDFNFAIEKSDFHNLFDWLIQTNKILFFTSEEDFSYLDQIQKLPIK